MSEVVTFDHVKKDLSPTATSTKINNKKTLLMDGHYFDTWGHFILDTLYPFYLLYRKVNPEPGKFNIICRDRAIKITTWNKVCQILMNLFKPKNIINMHNMNNTITFTKFYRLHTTGEFGFFSSDKICRGIQDSLKSHFREVGFLSNETLKSDQSSNNLIEFINYCVHSFGLSSIEMEKKLVTIVDRMLCRKIKNISEIESYLKNNGYVVELVFFENMSFKDQIKQMLRSEYVISTYGSNTTNGIFLHPEAKFIVCWPYEAKFFWSRKYCILHSAILGRGVMIYELDKSDYDQTDQYSHLNCFTGPIEYFYRDGNVIKLRPEKRNYQAIMDYPQPASYDLLNVDFTVNIEQFGSLMKSLIQDGSQV